MEKYFEEHNIGINVPKLVVLHNAMTESGAAGPQQQQQDGHDNCHIIMKDGSVVTYDLEMCRCKYLSQLEGGTANVQTGLLKCKKCIPYFATREPLEGFNPEKTEDIHQSCHPKDCKIKIRKLYRK
jgi:hypothetical protein